jgi:hypothetical protein
LFTEIVDDRGLKGFVKSVDQLNELILQYEVETTTKYSAVSAKFKNFGDTGKIGRPMHACTCSARCFPIYHPTQSVMGAVMGWGEMGKGQNGKKGRNGTGARWERGEMGKGRIIKGANWEGAKWE